MATMTQRDLAKPVSLSVAEAVLGEKYPQWAHDRHYLRRLCLNGAVRCQISRSGAVRRQRITVRVADLVAYFKACECEPVRDRSRAKFPKVAVRTAFTLQVSQSGGATHAGEHAVKSWTM